MTAEDMKILSVRVNDKQLAKIERAARIKGLPIAAFLRTVALEAADNAIMAYPEEK